MSLVNRLKTAKKQISLSFVWFCVSGTRGSQSREEAPFYIGSLPPSQCHKDPKSAKSSLGFRVGQKADPFCHHHTGTVSHSAILWMKSVNEKHFIGLMILFEIFFFSFFPSDGLERGSRGDGIWRTGGRCL